MGKVLAAFEELGKPILWGMGWVNRRLGSFGGHPVTFLFDGEEKHKRVCGSVKLASKIEFYPGFFEFHVKLKA
jgi:hypothetical protein